MQTHPIICPICKFRFEFEEDDQLEREERNYAGVECRRCGDRWDVEVWFDQAGEMVVLNNDLFLC